MTKRWLLYIIIGIAAIILWCLFLYEGKPEKPAPRDYTEIAASDTLRAVMEYNAISLNEDNDSIKGFYLELVQAFAHDHDMTLKVTPEMSMTRRLQGLLDGDYDMIADGIPVTAGRADSLLFSHPITRSSQVLVQRKPLNPTDSLSFITSQVMLAGKTLHIVNDSPAILRISNMIAEIGDTIYINTIDKYGPEQLIALVAYGDIDYAVCDRRIARLAADSLPQIDISIPIGFTQLYAWGINPHSPILRDSINSWLERYMQSKSFKSLAKKYAID